MLFLIIAKKRDHKNKFKLNAKTTKLKPKQSKHRPIRFKYLSLQPTHRKVEIRTTIVLFLQTRNKVQMK